MKSDKLERLWYDESLKSLRFGRWGFGWALLATLLAYLAVSAIHFVLSDLFAHIPRLSSTEEAFYTSLQLGNFLLLGNPYTLYSFLSAGAVDVVAVLMTARIQNLPSHAFFSLFGGFSFRRMFRMFACWFLLLFASVFLLLGGKGMALDVSFSILRHPIFLIAIVAVIAVQTFGEEALFRGFLYHSWVRVFPYPILVALFWSIVFAGVHWRNPDVQLDPVASLISITLFGLFTQWLVHRTGSLDAAWGLHFAHNTLVGLIVNTRPGYTNDVAILQITDTVLDWGGSHAQNPRFYATQIVLLALAYVFAVTKRSPFYIEPKAKQLASTGSSEADT